MEAILLYKGQQYRCAVGDFIRIPRAPWKIGETVNLTGILMISSGDNVSIGKPIVEDASIDARVIRYSQGRKTVSYKKKRRKGFHKKIGHRARFTTLQIEKINNP